MLFEFLFAQQNHADHCHEQQHGNDFKRERVLREQEFAERVGFAFESWFGSVWLNGSKRFHKDADHDADGNQPGGETKKFDATALFFFQVEQHDDEQKQHHNRAGVNQDLYRSQKERVQQQEQTRHGDDC